ncbi:MAG: substrate-binding domain-containing protein, partial [Desulfocucumaceae bacterium]
MSKSKMILLLAVAGIIIGAGSFFGYRSITGDKELKKIRLADSQPSAYKLAHYIARENYFYRSNKVKIIPVNCIDDKEALAALEKGEADVALVSPPSLILKKASDLSEAPGPYAFASMDRGSIYHFVARKNPSGEKASPEGNSLLEFT